MRETWRDAYDSWKLSGPPEDEYETDEDREAAEDAQARAEHLAEAQAEEDRYARKYPDA